MKILEVASIGYPIGGAEISVKYIRQELIGKGHDVRFFSSDTAGEGMFSDYQFKEIPRGSFLKLFYHLFYFESYKSFRKVLRDFQPDIIHFHTIEALSPSVFFAIKNIPFVVTIHGPEEFVVGLLPYFLPASSFKNRSYHLEDLTVVGKFRFFYYRVLQRPIYLFAMRKIRLMIAPSKYMGNALAKEFPKTEVRQIYNGIPLPEPRPMHEKLRVVFVGRLERVKGADYLLRAFVKVIEKIPECELRIIGDGGERNILEALAHTLGIADKVTFCGWVKSGSPIQQEYEGASVLVIPSVWPENLPTVCIEAFSIGRPVIGSDTGGIPELIQDGINGYVFPVADADALSSALIEMLSDRDKLLRMGNAASESAQRFNLQRFAEQIESTYKEVVLSAPSK